MKRIFLLFGLLSIVSNGFSQKDNNLISFKTDSDIIYGICFTNKGKALGIADNNTIKVYSTDSRELLNEFKNGHENQVLSIDISQDSTILVSGGKDSTIVIWDLVNNKILSSLSNQKGIITSVQISPDGNYLVSGGTDNNAYLYDLEKSEVIQVFSDHTDDITSVKFSPDGKLIATASGDKIINIYEVKSFKLIGSLTGHRSWVRDISFSKDGTKLISCGDDSRIITWNISDIYKIRKQNAKKVGLDWLLSIDFHKDKGTYAYGGMNGEIKIVTPIGSYILKIARPIQKILFNPQRIYLKVAVATRGNGVIMTDTRNMKWKDFSKFR